MPRYRFTVEYDGRSYAGWQRQAQSASVQGAVEAAFARLSGEAVTVHGAGRTDAGVHALGQVAHVDFDRDWTGEKLREALNAQLRMAGDPVAILSAARADPAFDARFSAVGRHYLYRIVNRRAPLALERGKAWHVARALDVAAMHEAAQRLVGRHDFTTFRSTQCQAKSPVRTLERLDVGRVGEVVEVRASARSFLHNQVRSLVGTLKRVGEGRMDADGVSAALAARSRAACAQVAPPDGLFLVAVDYPG